MSGRGPIRYQGQIVEWSNEKRCGFIRPRGAKDRDPLVFASISSMAKKRNTPVTGDTLTYELVKLPDTRANRRLRTLYRAENAAFLGDEVPEVYEKPIGSALPILGAVYVLSFGCAAFASQIAFVILVASIGSSLVSILMHFWDKDAAQKGDWRVSEATLIFWAFVCGWPGAAYAQHILRHKTRKASFQEGFRLAVAANILLTVGIVAITWPR